MTPALRSTAKMMHRAGRLRAEPTAAETRLWACLRSRRLEGIKFRRQHAIGPYIVDFCAPSQKLVIELDGSQHLGQETPDAERTKYLESKGYRRARELSRRAASSRRCASRRHEAQGPATIAHPCRRSWWVFQGAEGRKDHPFLERSSHE